MKYFHVYSHDCAHSIVQARNVGPFRNGKRTSPSPPRELQDFLSFPLLSASLLALPLAPASFTAGFHKPRNPRYVKVSVEGLLLITGLSAILRTTKLDRIISEVKTCHHQIFSTLMTVLMKSSKQATWDPSKIAKEPAHGLLGSCKTSFPFLFFRRSWHFPWHLQVSLQVSIHQEIRDM